MPAAARLTDEAASWEIDQDQRELRVSGVPVAIGGRAFEIIEILVERAGQLVTKNEMMARVWPGAIVGENTLQVHISAIRKALGPDRGMLKTAAGRGYRLLGNWTIRQPKMQAAPQSVRPPLPSARPFQTNVPVAASALIGREPAVGYLQDLLSAYRVVTLTGPGGIGKTVLAAKVACRMFPDFQGDVCLVELVSLADATLVPGTVADKLGLHLPQAVVTAEAVARAIGDTKLLLVLDNCEHLVGEAASLAEAIMRFCPHSSILATSREALRIDGEFVYHVPPLDVPPPDAQSPDAQSPDAQSPDDQARDVLQHSAVQLFLARTRAVRSEFSAQGETLSLLAAICRRLDGIPLAIEFAAAQAATFGIEQVNAALDDRFASLTRGRRTALPGHRTLRAVLDWSYELLSEAEQRLLCHLAIFSGGFTLDAAAAVANESVGGAAAAMEGISNLVAKSLIALDSETPSRWYLLETTRAYAVEKLAQSGAAGKAGRRHAEYCLALFAPFTAEGQLQAALDDLQRYRRESDNLRAALTWAFGAGGDAALGVALAAAATDFWIAASLSAEFQEWTTKALACIGDATGTRGEMVLQLNLAMTLAKTRGMIDSARQALTRALSLAQQRADFDFQQRATRNLWLFSVRAAAFDDALALARQYDAGAGLRDSHSRAVADYMVGVPLIYLGAPIEGSTRLRRAIDHYPIECRERDTVRFGTNLGAAVSCHLSVGLLSQGLLDAALRETLDSIEETRAADHPLALCGVLALACGTFFLSHGTLELAARYAEELIHHAHRLALRPLHAIGVCVRGSLAARQGDPTAGIDPLRHGLAEMRETADLLFYPYFVAEYAAALGATGRADDGIMEIDAALDAAQTRHRWYVPELSRVKGELLALRGSDGAGVVEDLFRGSMRLAQAQQALYWELSAAISLAELLRGQYREIEARALLAPVYDRFTEGFSAAKLQHAQTLLSQLN